MLTDWRAASERLETWGTVSDADKALAAKLCALMALAPDAKVLESASNILSAAGRVEAPTWINAVIRLLREEEGTRDA